MFLWDFVADTVLGGILDWIYGIILDALGEFFGMMGNMGAEIFEYDWVESIVAIMSLFGWSLFIVGLVVAVFEVGMEYQNGGGNFKDAGLNCIKGFMAVSLFTLLPVELYKFCISLQVKMTTGMSMLSISESANSSLENISSLESGVLLTLLILCAMGYAIIKVFFANLKRGGILLITVAVGALYMFSIPRGYMDGFIQWCKQVVSLCLTAFLQTIILIAGLGIMKDNILLGIGIILSASEIPRIAGQFGLDTSTKANIMSTVYAAQSAVNMTKTVVGAAK